ncbi:phosphoenolpyruvate carboxylase [Paraferrimonas sedimenticola]|uniref:Phosphoenolpyruvate carboxylase n=1 Tax=Paraferrimonas sedimenticola TaxID=375674 RepID=A0AA37RVJ7_9GAMM|nr:phosphoenolpyruvate carboxylase [Paraferrimonas sedimenticola]GLP95362.1 hypothetical protein GCM10007895_06680 [Paraferrimonas sedimenticola]
MSQSVKKAGVKLLRTLSNHAEVIMQAYTSGHVDETQLSPAQLKKLMEAQVLWRPQAGEDLRLRRAVRNLLESGLADERNRQVDANMAGRLARIRTTVANYKESMHRGAYREADVFLEELAETSYSLSESLQRSVRGLWHRIHNEFGYVSSVSAKIRENQLAQQQVSELLDQLELLKFDELAELAGSDRDLRRLLIVSLQQTHAEVSFELASAQTRLLRLLGKFREHLERSQLLKGFVLHCRQNPDYQPRDYAAESHPSELFNQAPGFIRSAAINTQDLEHRDAMLPLLAKLKIRRDKADEALQAGEAFSLEEQTQIQVEAEPIKQAVDDFFCEVIDSGETRSALAYLKQQELDFDPELWIYRVIAGYEGLNAEEQAYFALDRDGQKHQAFDNYIIEDVTMGLR